MRLDDGGGMDQCRQWRSLGVAAHSLAASCGNSPQRTGMGAQVAHIVSAWRDWFLVNARGTKCQPRKSAVRTLKAGLAVLRHKRVGRMRDMNPKQSSGSPR